MTGQHTEKTRFIRPSPFNHVNILQPEIVDGPLILFNPHLKARELDDNSRAIARQVDIVPTILGLLELPYNPQYFEGVDLLNFRGVLAGFTATGLYVPGSGVPFGRMWTTEPIFLRHSVRILTDSYVSNERGEFLLDFETKEKIDDERRLKCCRAYANRFMQGKYKGIVKIDSAVSYSRLVFGAKEVGFVPLKAKKGAEEEEKEIIERLRALGYLSEEEDKVK